MLTIKNWLQSKFKCDAAQLADASQFGNGESAILSSLDYRSYELGRMGGDIFRYHEWPLDSWYEPTVAPELAAPQEKAISSARKVA